MADQKGILLIDRQIVQRNRELPVGGHVRHAVLPVDDRDDASLLIHQDIFEPQVAMIQARVARILSSDAMRRRFNIDKRFLRCGSFCRNSGQLEFDES